MAAFIKYRSDWQKQSATSVNKLFINVYNNKYYLQTKDDTLWVLQSVPS